MVTFLCSASVAALLLQNPATDSARAALWARVAADTADAQAWVDLGRAYAHVAAEYHAHRAPGTGDTARVRAALDTAEQAFARAAQVAPGSRPADSAQVLRLYVWGERAYLAWETGGVRQAAATWRDVPPEAVLPPVLEELGENLLRACPREGVLITADDADTHAAWFLRFSRGLRPDLLILPLGRWRGDSVYRRRAGGGSTLRALAQRRPVCASMAFAVAPDVPGLRWSTRPLVWVSGPERRSDRVPPEDFVFAALRAALDRQETWTAPVLAVYRRAAGATRALCRPLETFGLKDDAGCR